MAVLAYCQTEGLCEEYERQKIRKKNGLRQVSSLVGASTARWGMRGAGDLRLQHRLCLPNCLCSEKGKDGSVLFFFVFRSIQCIVCCGLNNPGVGGGMCLHPCNEEMEESPGCMWKRGCGKTRA